MEAASVDLNSSGMTFSDAFGRAAVQLPATGIRSVAKALAILDLIARSGGEMTLTAIARAAEMNLSTCHHLLATLQEAGFVARLRGKRTYVLGAKILFLYTAALKQVNLPRRAQRVLEYLNLRTRQAVQIAVMQDEALVTLLHKEAPHSAIATPPPHGAAHATATGKAILAWLPDSELVRIVERRGLDRFTPSTITELPALIEELRLVRRHGYAMDREESQAGILGIATAIRDDSGTVVGAIGITCPASHGGEATVAFLREQVIWAAASLSIDLHDETLDPDRQTPPITRPLRNTPSRRRRCIPIPTSGPTRTSRSRTP
jgi:IclR family acetate operon transcriptional repressor